MNRQIFIPFVILFFLILVTTGVILYADGYRFGLTNGQPAFLGTGLLSATSVPTGAQVFINGHLTTATNNSNINLTPGQYVIKIVKQGYFPWEKKINIKKEVVSSADALLFPIYPSLQGITATGVLQPVIDPTHTRIAYTVASQSAQLNGVYVLDITSKPLITLQSAATQIADDTTASFSNSTLTWSPDGKQLLATISANLQSPTTYVLNPTTMNNTPQDVTETLSNVQTQWDKIRQEQKKAQLATLPAPLRHVVQADFHILSWSPDDTKILYNASSSAQLPYIIKPRLIGLNSTPEDRNLTVGNVYIYDLKQDQNYKVPTDRKIDPTESPESEPNWLTWFPDSEHLVYTHDKKIDVVEYDGINQTTIFALPFVDGSVFTASNDPSRIIILTSLTDPNIPLNLYAIGLK